MSITKGEITADTTGNEHRATNRDTSGPTDEEVFKVLSNSRRRYMFHFLRQREYPVSKREVSRQVAAWENGVPVEEVTPDMRKRVYIALHQTHIPQMREKGILKADPKDNDLQLTNEAKELQVYVDVVEDKGISWSEFYLGQSVIGCVVVMLTALEIGPFTFVPTLVWAAIIVGAITVASLVHVLEARRSQLGGDGPPPEIRDDDPVQGTDNISLTDLRTRLAPAAIWQRARTWLQQVGGPDSSD